MSVHVLTIETGSDRYVFKWDTPHGHEVIQTAARYAADPSLSFTWDHAAAVAHYAAQDLGPIGIIHLLNASAGKVPTAPGGKTYQIPTNATDLLRVDAAVPATDGKSPFAAWYQAILDQVAKTFGIGRPHPRSEGAHRGHRD